jgi:alpha-L-fucosidase
VDDAVYDFRDPEWFRLNPYSEWYLNSMRVKGSPTATYHAAHFGTRSYYSFGEDFERAVQRWKPKEWADLFADAGARYVVLTTKHHDGFTLWPSQVVNPHRDGRTLQATEDLPKQLQQALDGRGVRFGVYYSGGYDWTFKDGPFENSAGAKQGTPETEEYGAYVDAQYRELIERYHPSILWNDIRYPSTGHPDAVIQDFYRAVPDGVVNDRWHPSQWSDFTTPEYKKLDQITLKKWEECRGIGDSFGYNRAEGPLQTMASEEIIRLLIDIVSKNGNLLLDVGPEADGTIPDIQRQRLAELGAWMRRNGEAIYGTHPWIHAEGKAEDGTDVRFTEKDGNLYVILLQRPRERTISIPHMPVKTWRDAHLLGDQKALTVTQQLDFVRITLPKDMEPQAAYAIRLTSAEQMP